MNENTKINIVVATITLVFIIIGVILMVSGINTDEMAVMFSGIAILVLSFLIGMGILVFRILKGATQSHRKELYKFFDKKDE